MREIQRSAGRLKAAVTLPGRLRAAANAPIALERLRERELEWIVGVLRVAGVDGGGLVGELHPQLVGEPSGGGRQARARQARLRRDGRVDSAGGVSAPAGGTRPDDRRERPLC